MTTVHEDAAVALFRDFMLTEGGANALHVYFRGLAVGRWPVEYLNAVGQIHRTKPADWPMEQVAAFMMVHHWLSAGVVGDVPIGTASTPMADKCREENQRNLDDLPEPFVATVDRDQKSSVYGDGWLEWSEPIKVEQSLGIPHIDLASGRMAPVTVHRWVEPGRVPLEIGTSMPSKTREHLLKNGVARWPYGSDRITLFVRLKPLSPL